MMKRIAITGAEGFIGQHLRLLLEPYEAHGEVAIIPLARKDLDNVTLPRKISGVDAIVHLAGMNRGTETEIYDTNMRLLRGLLTACDVAEVKPHVLFPSSTHESRDSAYGRSKRDGAALLHEWAAKRAASATSFVFPHVFGEFARPFHNSGIATMCHQLSKGEPSEVNEEGSFELLHARSAVARIWRAIVDAEAGHVPVPGERISVPDAYRLLSRFAAVYRTGEFPRAAPGLEHQLFVTLHSVLMWETNPHLLTVRADARGSLFEGIRGEGEHQVFFSRTNPGIVRGNHYHARKIERFCVLEGEAEIRLRRILTDEVRTFTVRGDRPVAIDMPTYWTHSLRNTGSGTLLTAFWTSEHYDPEDPDTFPAET